MTNDKQVQVSQLWIYPLKSARGIRVNSARLCLTGFEYDRSFMLVEEKPSKEDPSRSRWQVMTMRTWPKMGLLRTSIEAKNGVEVLHVDVKGYPDSVDIPLVPSKEQLTKYIPSEVDIWDALVQPYDMGDEYSRFFRAYLGTKCKLAYVNINRPRYILGNLPPPAAQNQKHPVTGLSDGAPFLCCAEESMEDLNMRMEKPLPIIRFRPNIIFRGGNPFDEDHWAEISIGDAGKFWLLSRSPRCQLPNVDVDTGTKDPSFPYKALSKYRRVDKGSPYSPSFGMNAVADRTDGAEVHVGDIVTILREEEPRPYHNKLEEGRLAILSLNS